MMKLDFDDIRVDPEVFIGPRVLLGDIEGLARQLLLDGFVPPLLVWRRDGQPYLVDGWRRFVALEWIREHHPDVFTERFVEIDVEEVFGDEFEVLVQVVRRNLRERSYNLADLASAVTMLFVGFRIEDIATELRLEKTFVEQAIRLKVSVSEEGFDDFARLSTSQDDLPALLSPEVGDAAEQIQSFIRKQHAKRRERLGAGRNRPGERPGSRKHTKPRVATLRETRDKTAEELRKLHADHERKNKPTSLLGLPGDGERAFDVVFYRSEEAKLTARIKTLDWVLGEEPEIR